MAPTRRRKWCNRRGFPDGSLLIIMLPRSTIESEISPALGAPLLKSGSNRTRKGPQPSRTNNFFRPETGNMTLNHYYSNRYMSNCLVKVHKNAPGIVQISSFKPVFDPKTDQKGTQSGHSGSLETVQSPYGNAFCGARAAGAVAVARGTSSAPVRLATRSTPWLRHHDSNPRASRSVARGSA
jgi:hypothetical protein